MPTGIDFTEDKTITGLAIPSGFVSHYTMDNISGSSGIDAKLEQVRIYDRVLTSQEVSDLSSEFN